MRQLDQYTLQWLLDHFILLILAFIRISSMMVAAPFFNNPAVPLRVKILLSLLIAFFLLPLLPPPASPLQFDAAALVGTVFQEVLIGLLIGFTLNLLFLALRFAGGMLDIDMGFQTASLFNLDVGIPTLLGELYFLVGLMLFLLLNGHLYLIESVAASLKVLPINTFALTPPTIQFLIHATGITFLIALKIAAPILIALFITNLALALLARVAPQTNIFILSFQLKIAVGLLLLFATAPFLIIIIRNALENFQSQLTELLLTLKLTG